MPNSSLILCEACERDDHANCGMQSWCECECDPETCLYPPEGDEIEREDLRTEDDQAPQKEIRPQPLREPGGEPGEEEVMRLVEIRCQEEHPPGSDHVHLPVFVDPADVCAVYAVPNGVTVISLRLAGSLAVNLPVKTVMAQLFDDFGATKH